MRHSFGEINTMMRSLSGIDFDGSVIDNLSEECLQGQDDAESSHSKITLNSSNTNDSCATPRIKNSTPVKIYYSSIKYLIHRHINILLNIKTF